MAAVTSRPQDVVGMHFFNPAPIMKLVEVVSPVTTGADVTATVVELCAKIGKHPVKCGDRAGFIVNALLFPYLNDAVLLLESHYATTDEIDTVMTKGAGLAAGAVRAARRRGQRRVAGHRAGRCTASSGCPNWRPAACSSRWSRPGYLGRKTRRGFRVYG